MGEAIRSVLGISYGQWSESNLLEVMFPKYMDFGNCPLSVVAESQM